MPKVILEFDSCSEHEELDAALNGGKYKNQVDDIWQQLFRPRWKHTYVNGRLNFLLGLDREEEEMTQAQKDCNEVMDMLEALYREIKNDE